MDKQTAVLATEAAMQAKAAPAIEPAITEPEPAPLTPEDKEPKVTPIAAAVEEDGEDDPENTAGSDGVDTTARPRKDKGVGKRINELTREKYESLRRAEAAEARLATLEQQFQARTQPQVTQPTPQGRPTLEQFGFDQDAYEEARDAWVISQAKRSWTEEAQQADVQRKTQEKLGKFEQRIAKFEAEQPGAWETVMKSPVQPSQIMREAVAESEIGPKVAHYLALNLDEAFAITQLAPLAQAVAMGRIEAKLQQAPAPVPKPSTTVTRAPAPTPTIATGTSTDTTPGRMSLDDHIEAVRAKKRARKF